MRTADLTNFIIAREKVRRAKEQGSLPPWTKDPILAKYRFCNVHREDDRVTRWISENIRRPYSDFEDLWFILVVARLLNNPESLRAICAYLLPWKPERVRQILHERADAGLKNFNPAYIVSTNGREMNKIDYLFQFVLGPLWAQRKRLRPGVAMTLANYHRTLMTMDGLGSFMAAQVIADLKYVEPLKSAEDWHTWAASGPGSRRGLNRVVKRPVDAPWPGATWLTTLHTLHMAVEARLAHSAGGAAILPLHAQDLQNCLCEFDKMERTRLGEGVPKQLYRERV